MLIESHLPEVTEEHEKIVQHYFSDEKTDFARISVIRFLNSCLEWKPSFYKVRYLSIVQTNNVFEI